MLACFVSWLGFVVGMMIRGVDPTFAGEGSFFILGLPLVVLPTFNFSPAIQINLVLAPASKYFVSLLVLFASALSVFWVAGSLDFSYVFVFSSLCIQIVLLRFLVRRYFRTMGIYPGGVVFSPAFARENLEFPLKNRTFALLIFAVGMAQFISLAIII